MLMPAIFLLKILLLLHIQINLLILFWIVYYKEQAKKLNNLRCFLYVPLNLPQQILTLDYLPRVLPNLSNMSIIVAYNVTENEVTYTAFSVTPADRPCY